MHLVTRVALLSAWALSASAHFVLQYPNSLGFDDDNEGNGPCGGFDVSFNGSDASVPVGGFPVSLLSTHPAADFLFRATLNQKAPFNWTNLLPVVSETGLGQFCLPNLVAPSSFAGQQGVVQIIQDGPDGILYQCAAVNFVDGVNSTVGAGCVNATGLTATLTNQNAFSTSATTSGSASATTSPTSSGSAAPSSTGSAATANAPQVVTGFFGAVALVASFLL